MVSIYLPNSCNMASWEIPVAYMAVFFWKIILTVDFPACHVCLPEASNEKTYLVGGIPTPLKNISQLGL